MSKNGAEAKMVNLILKGVIAEASPAVQEKVRAAADKVRTVVAEYGDAGKVAIALVASELKMED